MRRVTCGDLLQEAVALMGIDTASPRYLDLSRGFALGQAEKTFNGVCRAFMMRPEPHYAEWHLEMLGVVCKVYELEVFKIGREHWVYRKGDTGTLRDLTLLSSMVDSGTQDCPFWHVLRAQLCGIPAVLIDEQFHLRYKNQNEKTV